MLQQTVPALAFSVSCRTREQSRDERARFMAFREKFAILYTSLLRSVWCLWFPDDRRRSRTLIDNSSHPNRVSENHGRTKEST